MKKRILSLVLAAVMIFSCLPSAFAVNNDRAATTSQEPLTLGNTVIPNEDTNVASGVGTGLSGSPDAADEDAQVEETQPLEKFESQGNTPFSETEAANKPADTDLVTFIVELETKPLLSAGFSTSEISAQSAGVKAYESKQTASIQTVQTTLKREFGSQEGFELGYTYTVGMTGMAVRTEYGNKAAIKAIDGVKNVYVAPTYSLPEDTVSNLGDASPLTANATTMVGANVLNESGYTGKGMKIAILDTGIVVDHPSFQALPEDALTEDSMTRESVEEIWSSLKASQMTHMLNLSYYNTKIPFVFNYFWGNFDVSHTGTAGHDHGTHVAGIAAGNAIDTTSAVGVAPDAQLIVMQVFSNSGGAGWDTIMAALEDCVVLGVDAINLSLGSAAGFVDPDGDMLEILEKYKETDIQVLIASGNDTNSAYMNLTGLDMALSSNPDIGLTGTPGTYSTALSVASVDNDGSYKPYFTVGGKQIGFNDSATTSATAFLNNLLGQELEYVVVPGLGTEDDFAQVNVEGKVALVSRGTISFPEKQANAQAAGAIACVVYNNVSGEMYMQINDGEGNIPCVAISLTDGQYMIEQENKTLKVCEGDLVLTKSDRTISSFSSWGVTPDLKLKPEIAGVGGNVYSATDPEISGSYYASWNGTSMATPQVTGAAAVLTEYFQKNYPEITGSELRQVVANLMMSTADVIMDGEVEYSPRAQGAGLVDLVDATTSPAYLSNSDASEGRPKAEFGDDPEKTGVYEFSFQINNLNSEKELSYTLDASVLTETLYYYFVANTAYALDADVAFYGPVNGTVLKYDYNDDGAITTADARILLQDITGSVSMDAGNQHYAYRDVNGDGTVNKDDVDVITAYCAGLTVDVDLLATFDGIVSGKTSVVTVPAGQTVNVDVVITLTGADKAYMDQFENGIYVEGFVYALSNDENGVDLQLPFVGFYGDWSAAPVLDTDSENYTAYPFLIYTYYSQVGYNPYLLDGAYGEQYNVISYSNPLYEIDFGQFRNAKKMLFTVTNSETGELYFELEGTDITKTYYSSSYGMIIPTYLEAAYGEVWDGTDANGKLLPSGTKVDYKIEAWLDDGDDVMDDAYTFTLTLDNETPEILNEDSLNSSVTIRDDRAYLKLDMKDDHYLAALIFLSNDGSIMGKYAVENIPGQTVSCEYDITGFGNEFSIVLADYACNENEIDVLLDLGDFDNGAVLQDLDNERLYGCETFDGAAIEAGWFSADKYDFSDLRNETYDSSNRYYSAEYVNGYLIAQNANTGNLELITPSGSYWGSKTLVTQSGSVGDYGVWVLYDMALDHSGTLSASYGTNWETAAADSLLAVGWAYKGDSDGDNKDDGYNALFNIKFTTSGSVYVQEIGRITGTDGADLLCLGITTEGDVYGIDTNGKFYSVSTETVWDSSIGDWGDYAVPCTYIGTTDFVNVENYSGCNVIQSMGYDHNDGVMYWYAHSQTASGYSYINTNVTYTIDLETGKCTEVGSYGPGGQTCMFIPNDLESDLFTMGVQATNITLDPSSVTLPAGQSKRLNVVWSPWNAAETEVTWASSDEAIATVDGKGIVTAVSEGEVTISATATVLLGGEWGYDENGNWGYIEPYLGEKTVTCEVKVVPCEDALYSYIIADYKQWAAVNAWYTYADKTPADTTKIGEQTLTYEDPFTGELVEEEKPSWQGGTYYNGYVYTTTTIPVDDGTGAVASATALYKSKVTEGRNPTRTTIGEPELVGTSVGVEIAALGFDYNTGRMYCIEGRHIGGLGIIDLDTGEVDMLGTYSGDLAANSWVNSMCVTADGTIVVSDAYSNLYTLDPDTLVAKRIYTGSGAGNMYWEAMTYDYNTGYIYWNPCQGSMASPLNLVILETNQWTDELEASVVDLGDVNTKYGVQQTVMFAIPENEPETKHIDTESIEITNGDVGGLVGGTLQLNAVTVPARPTVQTKTWTSSDESVVTVDRYGKLTYHAVGTAVITVSISNKDGATFTDSVNVTVNESAGEFRAFLNYDDASMYYDFWLKGNDYDLAHTVWTDSMISVYSLRAGAYYDGYYYAYNDKGQFLRINPDNFSDYKILGTLNRDANVNQITGMAVDYLTGTMYGLTLSTDYNYNTWSSVEQVGELVTIDLNNGSVTTVATVDFSKPVFALACDADGQLYAAGSSRDYYAMGTTVYKMDKTTAELTEFAYIADAGCYTGPTYYGGVQYNAQMTYDFGTDRLYLNATVDHQYWSYSYGMYMIQLGEEEPTVTDLGNIGLQMGSRVYEGNVFLGLMSFIPEDNEVPVAKVNGIMLNKTACRMPVGGEVQLTAQVRPSNALDTSVTWSSSDESVATVSNDGLIAGISVGTATITVTSNETGVTNTCKVTVVDTTGSSSTAYTISAQKDALISFNPELPGVTAEVVTSISGGANVRGMTYGDGCLYYAVEEGGSVFCSLYRFDLITKQSTYLGQLYTWVQINDIAYDIETGLLYATAGFYLFQFDVASLSVEYLNYYTNSPYLYDSNTWRNYDSVGVEVVDGEIYVFAKDYSSAAPVVLKYADKYLSSFTIVLSDMDLNLVSGSTDVAYDASNGLFYVTDAGNNIYSMDKEGNVEYIDVLGDGLDINGMTVIPAK